jgi:hypothetical protein
MKRSSILLANVIVFILIITLSSSMTELDISGEVENCVPPQLETTLRTHILSHFYENKGQIDSTDLLFYGKIDGGLIGFATSKILIWHNDFSTLTVLQFETDETCIPKSKKVDSHRVNFFMGSRGVFTDVKTSSMIEYEDIWPGVHLIMRYSSGTIEFESIINSCEFRDFNIRIIDYDSDDTVVSISDITPILESMLSEMVLEDENEFTPSEIYHENPLVFSTCIGGTGYDYSNAIDIDASGNIYIGGNTESSFFPIFGGINTELVGESNLFVIKLSENGDQLLYATFIGGNDNDYVYDIEVDDDGNTYIVGATSSSDFPFMSHFDSSVDSMEGFLLKLDADGSELLSSTSIGGTPTALEIDNEDNIIITGNAASDLPLVNAYNSTSNGGGDIFLMKVNSTDTELIFSTFVGGSSYDVGTDVAVDDQCNIYVTGTTHSSDFPLLNGFNDTLQGDRDAFVLKFNSSGTGLNYSTFLGGISYDFGYAIEVDTLGNAYIVGETYSIDFPILNPFQSTLIGGVDAFVTKLNASGTGLNFSTFIGGNSSERPYDIEIDNDLTVYIAGTTQSSDYPLEDPYRDYLWSGNDIFLTRFNSSGDSLLFSTYFGGDQNEQNADMILDSERNLIITGMTSSDVFPTVTDYDNPPNGYVEAFVAKFSDLTDQDDDFIRDYMEEFYGTDVNNNDTDFDLVNDYDELFVYNTNALSNDTDLDLLDDYTEIFVFETDPNIADTDFDDLSDYAEIFVHFTDPLNNDTDFDDLNDFAEIFVHFTDPLNNDTDNDTLSDYIEVVELGTNPLSNDSDGDSYLDAWEIENGFDPLDPLDPPEDVNQFAVWSSIILYSSIGISLVIIAAMFMRNRRLHRWDEYDF